jgi:hypothetical protein
MSAELAIVAEAERAGPYDALGYQAPFLIEKLLREGIVDTPEEGEALFLEVKRYLVLARLDRSFTFDMHSLRVDGVWHQFILYTVEYTDFCRRFFGRYLHHSPSNAPEAKSAPHAPAASFAMFRERYEKLFGETLPDVWYDERSVAPNRRIFNHNAGKLSFRQEGDMVDLIGPAGDVVFSVNDFGRDALSFIAATGVFYVRELPGELDDEEKVALIEALVEARLLKVGC